MPSDGSIPLSAGIEATQVQIDLPVRKMVRELVRPVHREGSLPDARDAADRGDHRGGPAATLAAEHG
jgi:hypothetical protein